MRAGRLTGLRRIPPLVGRVRPDVVLFNSWHGKVADNPRAIDEELRRRDAPFERVWVVEEGSRAPEGATVVRPDSLAYLRRLGAARYIVSNNTLPGYFRKKPGATYVQTWHGGALKRIAFDIERPSFPDSERYLETLGREVAGWDYLVAPSRFSADVFRRAFRYEGEILETGYPRTDLLVSVERERVRARTREELGISPETRAVLYAPTWRDNTAFSTDLDLTALAERLGGGHVVMLRAHKAVAATATIDRHPRLLDVSGRDDVRELLLAADVLVTDYSSVMFDFAVTGKPMLFFTYDLDAYRDALRGFCFDFASEAPGPLVSSGADLIEGLRSLDDVAARYADRYARFRRRHCHLDDGRAAERVVDAVFAGQPA
jgi:CDP-glycerol glycerophosphotransferase